MTVDKIIETARDFLGLNEADGSHHLIIDLYNSVKPYPRGYRLTYKDSWCAAFVTVVFQIAGLTKLIGRECGCEEFIKIFKKLGIWIEDGNIVPQRGDIILYNWHKDTQPNDGYADHIGIVAEVDTTSRKIKVIEGNYNDSVGYREIKVGNGYIRGYARPDYESLVTHDDYENLGWNKDAHGWWYAYGKNKGDYYANTVKTINNELFMFDSEGYCLKNATVETDSRGVVTEIRGDRL